MSAEQTSLELMSSTPRFHSAEPERRTYTTMSTCLTAENLTTCTAHGSGKRSFHTASGLFATGGLIERHTHPPACLNRNTVDNLPTQYAPRTDSNPVFARRFNQWSKSTGYSGSHSTASNPDTGTGPMFQTTSVLTSTMPMLMSTIGAPATQREERPGGHAPPSRVGAEGGRHPPR